MRAREFVFEDTAEGLTEIENMPAKQFVGGKDMLNTRKRPAKQNLQPLMSGSDLLYAVDQDRHGERVVIVEPGVSTGTKPRVVAALYLVPVDYLPNTVQVTSITVNEDYRGRGLAKALYNIVLTKMRKNLLSGDAQTPGGKRNWMSLDSIPGVEVKGMVRIPNDIFDMHKTHTPSQRVQKYYDQTMDQIMELGGQFFYNNKTNDSSYWLFDVVPGKGQLEPYVKNSLSKLYGYDAGNLLLATWNRGINESQQDLAEDNPDYDEDRYLKSDPGTPLSFPKGTTLVNVSDVYDWYKLGMAVSDLDDADPRTFNKGVPHTVFAFGSEEEEHKMIPLLKRLGFTLHDIDSPEDYQKAIRADEAIAHLEEMAGAIHSGVRKVLMDKGYKYLGGGIDKQAYLEPGTGQVLIVFGYRKGMKDFSPDQRMFIDWINYCNANKDNPHLPRFSGFESFQFGGQNYIQARMEPLQELSDDVGMLVHQIDDAVNNAKRNFKKQIKNITSYASFASAEEGDNIGYELEDTIEYLGGEQAAMNLLKTVRQVQQFARKHQFTVDLHRGNYMARSDGTIVVNDPFVLWLTSSGNRQPWGLR